MLVNPDGNICPTEDDFRAWPASTVFAIQYSMSPSSSIFLMAVALNQRQNSNGIAVHGFGIEYPS